MKHFPTGGSSCSLGTLLDDATSRPDLVAIFLGVLELIRMRRLIITEGEEEFETLHGVGTRFIAAEADTADSELETSLSDYNR